MKTMKYRYYMWRANCARDLRLKSYYVRRAKKALYKR